MREEGLAARARKFLPALVKNDTRGRLLLVLPSGEPLLFSEKASRSSSTALGRRRRESGPSREHARRARRRSGASLCWARRSCSTKIPHRALALRGAQGVGRGGRLHGRGGAARRAPVHRRRGLGDLRAWRHRRRATEGRVLQTVLARRTARGQGRAAPRRPHSSKFTDACGGVLFVTFAAKPDPGFDSVDCRARRSPRARRGSGLPRDFCDGNYYFGAQFKSADHAKTAMELAKAQASICSSVASTRRATSPIPRSRRRAYASTG